MAAKKGQHSPLTLVLFGLGLATETVLSTYVGEHFMLNTAVVLGTAIYFYSLDDVEDVIKSIMQWKKK